MYRYVNKLIARENDIVSQLKLLRLYRRRAGVYQYIDLFLNNAKNQEPTFYKYYEYCVAKYFFEFDVKEVKEPLPRLYMPSSLPKKIEKEVLKEDNIINELKVLRKYKNNKSVKMFMDNLLSYTLDDYELYCITKYYDGIDVPKVNPPKIKLYPLYETKKVTNERLEGYPEVDWDELKKDDKVIILDGPFTKCIGKITRIETDNLYLNIELFGFETEIELDKTIRVSRME